MARETQLGLHEKFLLLSLVPSIGAEHAKLKARWLGIGVAGAILYMLLRRGRVTIEGNRVTARGSLRLDGSRLDQLLRDLETRTGPFNRPRISAWLRRTAKLKPQLAVSEQLVGKGILKPNKRDFFLVMPELRDGLKKRLRETVVEGKVADEEMAVLAALMEATEQLAWLQMDDEKDKMKAQMRILGRQAGPALLAVRTAVAEQKLRKSLQNVIGLAVATGVTALMARVCSN